MKQLSAREIAEKYGMKIPTPEERQAEIDRITGKRISDQE